ncbi:hypothetical protein CLOM_g3686 [Closterium sp. NIES-68]|nr:hypothetical protein CLOM_g3686 [Closterium sp. NIES-68]
MSILSTLWDEVLGGPKPEKCQDRLSALSFPQSPSNTVESGSPVNSPKASWEDDFEKRRKSVEVGRVSSQPVNIIGAGKAARKDRLLETSHSLPATFKREYKLPSRFGSGSKDFVSSQPPHTAGSDPDTAVYAWYNPLPV